METQEQAGSQHGDWLSDQLWGSPALSMGFLTTLQVDLPQVLWGKHKDTPGDVSYGSACWPRGTYVSELDQTQLPELSHAAVGGLHLQE